MGELKWRDQGFVSDSRGSNGFQFVVFGGAISTVVKRIPSTRRHGKTIVHKQKQIKSVDEGKKIAQEWEDEEAAKWDTGIWE